MDDTRATVSEFFRYLSNWDAEAASSVFAEEIDWFVPAPPGLPWGGRRTRRTEIVDYFRTMWAHFRIAESKLNIEQILVDGQEAVALGTFSHVAASTGSRFTTPMAMHLHVSERQITKLQLYEDTYAVAKGFGLVPDTVDGELAG